MKKSTLFLFALLLMSILFIDKEPRGPIAILDYWRVFCIPF